MARKYMAILNNQAVDSGTTFSYDPLLRDVVAGTEQLVAPDIVVPIPKQTASPAAVTTTPLATGAIVVSHAAAGGAGFAFDIMYLRLPPSQRLLAAQAPEASADGFITTQLVFFTVLNGVALGKGAVYADNADATRTYTVQVAKAAADGATTVVATRNPTGNAEPAPGTAVVAGQLNYVSGTGDATVAFSARTYEKSAMVFPTTAITAAGIALTPQLARFANYAPPPAFAAPDAIPDICIPIPAVIPGATTRQTYVATVLAAATAITCNTGNIADNGAHATLFMRAHSVWRVIAALVGASNDRRRYFTIANGVNASQGAVYADNALATRLYTVIIAKVAGDGSVLLTATVPANAVADGPTQNGTLNLVSGTGDAAIAWASGSAAVTQPMFEKYVDIRQNTAVSNAGTAFGFDLVENGTFVMPSIVIPIPKAVNIVPFVTTDLTGAAGPVTIQVNGGGPANCDILALRLPTAWRP